MYFNRRVLIASAVIATQGVVEAGECKQSFVKAASEAHFLKYALVNCVAKVNPTTGTPQNSKDKDVIDPQSCLTTFELATGVAFSKESPACVAEYTGFVKAVADDAVLDIPLQSSPFQDISNSHKGCFYDSAKDEIYMSYVCWNRLSAPLTAFQQGAGYPIFIQPCDAVDIRKMTLSKIIQKTFTDVLSAASADLITYGVSDFTLAASTGNGANHIVVPDWKLVDGVYKNDGIDLETGMCLGTYQSVLDMIQGSGSFSQLIITEPPLGVDFGEYGVNGASGGPANWGLPSLQLACKADITAPACANSQLMTGLRSLFTSWSGYDMAFTGPLCTADKITVSNQLNPTPFQFFGKCGLLPSENSAQCSLDAKMQYMTLLNTTVGYECLGCFAEMADDVADLLNNGTVKVACNSSANLTSAACVAALSGVAADFKNCTGSDLYTALASFIPATNTSNTSSTTNTTNTTDTDSDANDATRIIMSSSAILLVAVMTYLM